MFLKAHPDFHNKSFLQVIISLRNPYQIKKKSYHEELYVFEQYYIWHNRG